MEKKSISLEMKDLSKDKRTAVIAHAVYNNIDRTGDISTKGMFKSSWERKDQVDFYFNHDEENPIGNVIRTFEDEQKAYTEVKFGDWTAGNDVLEMADAGVLKGASFGYETEKKDYKTVNGKKIRVLKQVKHIETSLLTKQPANPLAGIVKLTKAFDVKALSAREQELFKTIVTSDTAVLQELVLLSGGIDISDDLYTWINYNIATRSQMIAQLRDQLRYNTEDLSMMKAYAGKLEKFIKDTKASDECIESCEADLFEIKSIISRNDTGSTPLITDGEPSVKEFSDALYLLTLKI